MNLQEIAMRVSMNLRRYDEEMEGPTRALFGDEAELPPTWSEGSLIFHTTEKCQRLQAIRRNRRIQGKPGVAMRQCFNCEDIVRTKRSG